MKVKLTNYIEPQGLAPNTLGLTLNKTYEVIAIVHFRELKTLDYFLVDDDKEISCYSEDCFEIIDNTLEEGYIVKNDERSNTLFILPDFLEPSFFYDFILFSETIRLTPSFKEHFKHLFSEE